jgi:hypothetical protein
MFYGDKGNRNACFGFWLFRLYGARDLRLLDGGRQAWLAEERPPTKDEPVENVVASPAAPQKGDTVTFRRIHGVTPWESEDPSSSRVWWSDAGVYQNMTFPVHPDPISGMHCWHQKVRVRRAQPGDRYADIHVDFRRARAVYRKWLALARPAAGELRRPIWLFRPVKPALKSYRLPQDDRTEAARRAREARAPSAYEFADLVDWSPELVWGPLGEHPGDR